MNFLVVIDPHSALSNFKKGDAVCAVILNLSNAFDSVDRNTLLRKLDCYRVHLQVSLYLDGRKQFLGFGGFELTCCLFAQCRDVVFPNRYK